MTYQQTIRTLVYVNGLTVNNGLLPVTHWEVTMAGYGSPSTFTVTCSIQNQAGQQQNLINLVQQQITMNKVAKQTVGLTSTQLTKIEIYVGYIDSTHVQTPTKNNLQLIFTGFIDQITMSFERDEMVVTGRDLSSVLQDARIITVDQNMTPTQIAISYAKAAGLNTQFIQPTPASPGYPNGAPVGYFFNETHTHTSFIPRARWDVLRFLAHQISGFEVFVLPTGYLWFGKPPALNTSLAVSAGFNSRTYYFGDSTQLQYSCKTLMFKFNPRRNKTFRVVVDSYHPKYVQTIEGSITIVGAPLSVTIPLGTRTIKAQGVKGQGGVTVYNELSSNAYNVPVYTYYVDGLTADQAQAKAESIAADIAKREFSVMADLLGDPLLNLNSTVTFRGSTAHPITEFEGIPFYPQRITHAFDIKGGYTSSVEALTIPPIASDDPNNIYEEPTQ